METNQNPEHGPFWMWLVLLGVILIGVGFFAWVNFGQKETQSVFSVADKSNLVTTPSVNPVKSIKTYTNSVYQFSFNYPGNWTYSEENIKTGDVPGEVVFRLKFKDSNAVSPLDITVSDKINGNIVLREPNGMDLTVEQAKGTDLIVAGQKAKKYLNNIYVLSKDSRVYTITGDSESLGALNDVISSFQFTTPVSTADWKTYTNKNYSFSVKYPSDYTISELAGLGLKESEPSDILFSSKDGSEYTIEVVDKTLTLSPNGMDPIRTTSVQISGKNGSNFDDVAYGVEGTNHRYRLIYTGNTSIAPTQIQKDILLKMVESFRFTN